MTKDYNDVEKLLDGMNLGDFAYRAFHHRDSTGSPALRVVRSAEPNPADIVPSEKSEPRPLVAPALATEMPPAPMAPATPVAESDASSRVADALERLRRGSIARVAPPLHLDLALPVRQPASEAPPVHELSDRPISDVLRRLAKTDAVGPTRIIPGGKR